MSLTIFWNGVYVPVPPINPPNMRVGFATVD